jgi:hypothetical protein
MRREAIYGFHVSHVEAQADQVSHQEAQPEPEETQNLIQLRNDQIK